MSVDIQFYTVIGFRLDEKKLYTNKKVTVQPENCEHVRNKDVDSKQQRKPEFCSTCGKPIGYEHEEEIEVLTDRVATLLDIDQADEESRLFPGAYAIGKIGKEEVCILKTDLDNADEDSPTVVAGIMISSMSQGDILTIHGVPNIFTIDKKKILNFLLKSKLPVIKNSYQMYCIEQYY